MSLNEQKAETDMQMLFHDLISPADFIVHFDEEVGVYYFPPTIRGY